MENIPVQYISFAILVTNIIQVMVAIHYGRKRK